MFFGFARALKVTVTVGSLGADRAPAQLGWSLRPGSVVRPVDEEFNGIEPLPGHSLRRVRWLGSVPGTSVPTGHLKRWDDRSPIG